MTTAEKLKTVSDNVPKVYESGKKSEYDRFWDTFQNNGMRSYYNETFNNHSFFSDNNYNPKYPIILAARPNWRNNVQFTFRETFISDTKVDIVCRNFEALNHCFQESTHIKIIRKIILERDDIEFDDTFYGCTALESIRFEGTINNNIDFADCVKLDKESIVHIFNCLGSSVSEKNILLSEQGINSTFGINVKDPSTYPPGSEYYNIINSKNNWTIEYY